MSIQLTLAAGKDQLTPGKFGRYDTGKDQKLTTDFVKILTFSLARGFDLVLSLGVTTPLITPVMGIS